jgi:hypothetical protein
MSLTGRYLVWLTNSRGTEPDDTFWVNSVSFRIAWLHVWPGGSFLKKETNEICLKKSVSTEWFTDTAELKKQSLQKQIYGH